MSELTLGLTWLALAVILLIAQAGAFGYAGGLMLEPVDGFGAGFAWGFFLGPVGLVIAWVKRENRLLERADYEKRHRAALEEARAPKPPSERPGWAPDEPPRRFK